MRRHSLNLLKDLLLFSLTPTFISNINKNNKPPSAHVCVKVKVLQLSVRDKGREDQAIVAPSQCTVIIFITISICSSRSDDLSVSTLTSDPGCKHVVYTGRPLDRYLAQLPPLKGVPVAAGATEVWSGKLTAA